MAEKRRGLGRGLGALISSAPSNPDTERDTASAPQRIAAPPTATESGTPPVSRETRTSESAESEITEDATGRRKESVASSGTPKTTERSTGASTAPAVPGVAVRGDGGAIADATDPLAAKETQTAPQRKSRPVDMFFAPGKQEDDGGTDSNVDSSGDNNLSDSIKRSKSSSKRRQMPDFIGEVRSRSAEQSLPAGVDEPLESDQERGDEVATTIAVAPSSEADSASVSRETLVEVPGASFAEIPVGNIHPNRKQPRTAFDQEDMAELVHSIKEVGLLQPIVVRPSGEEGDREYELVMGERRWRATQEAGLATIPAIVRATSDMDLLRDALLENLHRSQLNPLEEAAAYQQLLQEFGCTQEELSDRIGRSRPQISNTIRLMKLPALVQRRVAAGVLSAGHARALLALADAGDMERVAQRIVNEGLSVRATEEIVALSDGLRRPSKESTPRPSARHERLDFLATSLSDRLDTSVKITLGAKKGRVSIEFASVDDLNRIMGVIAPGSPN